MSNLGSQIWCLRSEKLGSLQSFNSERDMESFLMNNPTILVGLATERSEGFLVRSQQFLKGVKGDVGRIDIVGLAKIEKGYELRIFELKNVPVNAEAVNQVKGYRDDWGANPDLKEEIRSWIAGLPNTGLDEKKIAAILESPVAVVIGPSFLPEAIVKCREWEINGVRLARFKGDDHLEYYVIIEDQVGEVLKKRVWSWREMIDRKLIEPSDTFVIKHNNLVLRGKPDPERLDWNWIYLYFDDISRKFILDNEETIRKNMAPDAKKAVERGLKALKEGKSVVLTNATALAFFALNFDLRSYWTPIEFWEHERSKKTLAQLKEILFT
jgi:hypothetical protein